MPDRIALRRSVFVCGLALAAVLATALAPAQDTASAPVRAARLVSSQGTVTVTDGNNPPAAAQMNLPLLQGIQIATGSDGQAEIEFEDGSVARLTPNSALSLDKLDIAPGQLFVTDLSLLHGLAYFELRATPEYVYSVSAGGDTVSPVENATVRIDFDQPPASIAVLDGTAQVQRANSFKVDVLAGSTLSEDASDASRYSVTQQIAANSWDQWNADMDQQAAQQSSNSTNVRDNYAGAQGYGWSDLDADGTWYDVPGQGQVWQPLVADDYADFDPYGNGAWVWYPGMGYLWASAYPWGWTPYLCGAWSFYDGFGWGWAPGMGCGGFGWGFVGGGFPVNIVRWPRGYKPVRVPVAKPGPVRPVIPVRIASGTGRTQAARPLERGPRQIAGVTARPIVPRHVSFAGGDANAGASLRRDFPIDRVTHAPAMGLVSARSPSVYRSGPQMQQPPMQAQRSRGQQQSNPPSVPQPARPAFARPQQNQPRQAYTPQPHTAPAHPQYMPQQRQSFSPPATPRYSPPPQPHFSPPPPPHVSAPPPAPAGHR